MMAILSISMILPLIIIVNMKLEEYLNVIEQFLKEYLEESHMDIYVLGLSGGVDSSLVATLTKRAVGKEKIIGIMMPIDSIEADLKDAKQLADHLGIKYLIIDASKPYHELLDIIKKEGETFDVATCANLKARIRMSIVYAYAQAHRGLVLGTDNADERFTGYFTKWGDGAADLLPICHLLKREVVEASKILGVPHNLAERIPSAGLFEGQTDEKEMRVTYREIDDYLLGKEVSKEAKERIEYLHRISEHKRKDIPTPREYVRD